MATWRAKCWLGSSSGYQELEVQSNTLNGAKEQFKRIYGAEQIINLREVRSRDSSSSGSGVDFSGAGGIGLIGLLIVGWAFVSFTPWILMGLGGAAGAWIGEKVTGQSIEEYNEREDDLGHSKVAIVLALSLLLGGIGFVKGDEIKKGFDAPDAPTQVQSAK